MWSKDLLDLDLFLMAELAKNVEKFILLQKYFECEHLATCRQDVKPLTRFRDSQLTCIELIFKQMDSDKDRHFL